MQRVDNMNIKIDTEKIINFFKGKQKNLPYVLVGIAVVIFGALTYFALYPRTNDALVVEGEEKVRSLDIRFNMKLLGELGATKTPIQLGTAGGRDPFSGF